MVSRGMVNAAVWGALCLVSLTAHATDVMLFSEYYTTPSSPVSPPFTVTGTAGVMLTLNGSGVATGFTSVSLPAPVPLFESLNYLSHTGTINPREGFAQHSAAMTTRVNSEVGRLDDLGIVAEKIDAPLNLDFTGRASVVFDKFSSPLDHLLIAEDAGLDPFRLEYSANGKFTDTVMLFNGFTKTCRKLLNAHSDIGLDDSGTDMDQAYLFTFDKPLQPGYLRITEIGNYGGSRLEVDFISGGHAESINVIPEPHAGMLTGAGIGLALMILRRSRTR